MRGSPQLTLTFFHDVVCGWCFNLSPRLRTLAAEFDLDIRHRTFVLQDSPERMVHVFGSHAAAKATVLGHWEACAASSENPQRFAIEKMCAAPFNYPHGLPAALACQVAQQMGGASGHWRLFDALQRAHLSQARNIADQEVLLDVAKDAGFDPMAFRRRLEDGETLKAVETDRALAHRLGVRSVPTVIVLETGARLRNGPLDELRAQLLTELSVMRSPAQSDRAMAHTVQVLP